MYQDHEVLYMLRIFEQMKFRFDREGGDKGGRETNLRGCSFGGCQCSVEDTHTHTERVMTESIGL